MTALDLCAIARALDGEVSGRRVLAPGPQHSPKDRSLCISLAPAIPSGFLVHSFAGDDPIQCKDYVRARLGLPHGSPATNKIVVSIRSRKGARIELAVDRKGDYEKIRG